MQGFTVCKTLAMEPHILSSYRAETFSSSVASNLKEPEEKYEDSILSSSLPSFYRDLIPSESHRIIEWPRL